MSNEEIKKKLDLARNAIDAAMKALEEKSVPLKQPKERQNLKQHRRAKYAERYSKY